MVHSLYLESCTVLSLSKDRHIADAPCCSLLHSPPHLVDPTLSCNNCLLSFSKYLRQDTMYARIDCSPSELRCMCLRGLTSNPKHLHRWQFHGQSWSMWRCAFSCPSHENPPHSSSSLNLSLSWQIAKTLHFSHRGSEELPTTAYLFLGRKRRERCGI